LLAGLGADSILINASNISALEQTGAGNRARVDGGGGIDTLVLEGSDLTLDLTKISIYYLAYVYILKHYNLLLNPKFNTSMCIGVTVSVNIISDAINSLINC
jgi:hypothetical protein